VLKELELEDVPIYSPNQGKSLYDDLGIAGTDFTRKAWWGICAIDHLEKVLLQLRPYEVNKGETYKKYWHYLEEVQRVIIESGKIEDLVELMEEAVEDFKTIEIENFGDKPRIGIVGEIYVRSNDFSNEYIIEEIESLGGEVWLPPVSEWFLYTNWTRMRDSVWRWDWRNWLKNYLTDRIQKKDEHKIAHPFGEILVNYPEPEIDETVEIGSEYIGTSFEGEAVLSIGKAIDFVERGLDGVVNVMPFTCMPGTVVSAISKRLKEDLNNVPILNMAYDGLEEPGRRTRLEAFIYQAKQFKENREKLEKEESIGA
jgi:predicted nucleotide-binding protein (sugar kinase/HSP70/actin superfamily)